MAKKIKVIHRVIRQKKDGAPVIGLADAENRTVEIDKRTKHYSHLRVFIHEFYHIHNPDWSETKVSKLSSELAQALYKHGYRRVDRQ